jgi:hypothetical protein
MLIIRQISATGKMVDKDIRQISAILGVADMVNNPYLIHKGKIEGNCPYES